MLGILHNMVFCHGIVCEKVLVEYYVEFLICEGHLNAMKHNVMEHFLHNI